MSDTNLNADYEQFIKTLNSQNDTMHTLSQEKQEYDTKFWNKLQTYFVNQDLYENQVIKMNFGFACLASQNKMESNLQYQQQNFEKHINGLTEKFINLEVKCEDYIDNFVKTINELYEDIHNVSTKFNSTNIKNEIDKYQSSIISYNDEIEGIKQILPIYASLQASADFDPADIYNLHSVTTSIQEMSRKKYGDFQKLQNRLLEVKNNIAFLSKKIQHVQNRFNI